MWSNEEWVRLAALACLCRGLYEACRPPGQAQDKPAAGGNRRNGRASVPGQQEAGAGPKRQHLTGTEKGSTVNPEPALQGLPPQVEEWKRKAVRAYARAQDRKWRNWAEAMFERRPEPRPELDEGPDEGPQR
jgi:hypothetical protein